MKKISDETKALLKKLWYGPSSYRGNPQFNELERVQIKITAIFFEIIEQTKGSPFEDAKELGKASQALVLYPHDFAPVYC